MSGLGDRVIFDLFKSPVLFLQGHATNRALFLGLSDVFFDIADIAQNRLWLPTTYSLLLLKYQCLLLNIPIVISIHELNKLVDNPIFNLDK